MKAVILNAPVPPDVVIKPLEVKPFVPGKEEIIPEGEKFFPSERAEKFYISSGGGYPVFAKEVIVDPFKAKEGDRTPVLQGFRSTM